MAKRTKTLNKNDLSRKRRRKRNFKAYFFSGAVIFFLVLIIVLARLPSLQIKSIKVSDTKRISASSVEDIVEKNLEGNYMWVFPKRNFMSYPKKAIKNEIMESLPAILEIEISTELDRNLYVKVKERLAYALWCSAQASCYYMDDTGTVFARALNPESGLLKYFGLVKQEGGGSILGQEYGGVKFFNEVKQLISKVNDLGFRVTSVEVQNEMRAQINFSDNSYLLFLPYEKDKGELLDNINIFVNDLKSKNGGSIPKLQYIDARYGNKIFYKILEGV